LGNIISSADPNYLPVGPSHQRKYLSDLSKSVQNAGGLGIIFWEPAWVSTPCRTPWGQGSSQEHVAFFDHRNNLNFMKNGGGGWPNAFKNNISLQPVSVIFKVDKRGVHHRKLHKQWQLVDPSNES
jgi:arabinogalactan endo-1,4-beta-galactosidase